MTPAFQSVSALAKQPITVGTAAGPARCSPEAIAWAETRGLSRLTLEAMPVASGTTFFPDAKQKLPALFFKYGKGWKARAFPKKHFVSGGGFTAEFWNLPRVLADVPGRVFITEGEMDALALVEAGVDPGQVLSVPTGAKQNPSANPLASYGYVTDALKAGLSAVKQIVWCGDADGPGYALRNDMVQVFGAARFLKIEWPEGAKDANDFLVSDGPEALLDLVTNGAVQWPVHGLYALSDLKEPPPLTLWSPGFPEWESKVKLAPKCLSVFTGHPGHGKTQFANEMIFNIARAYGVKAAVASFETRPRPHLVRQYRTLHSGKLEKNMTSDELASADNFIAEHYQFIVNDRPDLRWLLDVAEVAAVRGGCKIILLDPWNRLETHKPASMPETDYIGMCLREMHTFAQQMDVHLMVCAHPAKQIGEYRGRAPMLDSISGSKHWDNVVDQGFCVWRPKIYDSNQVQTECEFFHLKARFSELGYPCKLPMNFDMAKQRYVSTDYKIGY